MIVVVDSGPVIHLSWLGHLGLLKSLYTEVLLPPSVQGELLASSIRRPGIDDVRQALDSGWIRVQEPDLTELLPSILHGLDLGERHCIALALGLDADLFVSDDADARTVALQLGIEVTGTIGILRRARSLGLVEAVIPLAIELRRLGQWISERLIEDLRSEESR